MEDIISMDYGNFEVIKLYCTRAQADRNEARAIMKYNEYGFKLFKFDRLIPYSADLSLLICNSPSCATIFFVDNRGNDGWKLFCGESHEAVESYQGWMEVHICRHCK